MVRTTEMKNLWSEMKNAHAEVITPNPENREL